MYFLAIATNIPQRLKTGFVVQGHKYIFNHVDNFSLIQIQQTDPVFVEYGDFLQQILISVTWSSKYWCLLHFYSIIY